MIRRKSAWQSWFGTAPVDATIRIDRQLWTETADYLFDFEAGREHAGVLLVRSDMTKNGLVLIAVQFLPVTEEYVKDGVDGLNYDGGYSLHVAEVADKMGCGAMLVHAHTLGKPPLPSFTDTRYGLAFLRFMRRRRPKNVNGLLVIGNDTVTGICDTPNGLHAVKRVVVAGIPSLDLPHKPYNLEDEDSASKDRQLLAIGPIGQAAVKRSTVAVIGLSGGGSHVAQQLIHAGVGTLIVIDKDIVDERNLRRLVGAVKTDIDHTPKVDIPVRMALAVRPEVRIIPMAEEFPSSDTITQLRDSDVIIGCVDNWAARDAINTLALQYRIPYIDIGAAVVPANEYSGMRVGGQIAIVAPDGPCLRCMKLVTDERVAEGRKQQQYAENVHEPQVVSVNGALASETVTSAMMLLAGDNRLARRRRYIYPPGHIAEVETDRDPNCPSCRAARLLS